MIPVSVEQSATKDDNETKHSAELAIDTNMDTSSYAVAGSDSKIWIKLHLGQVHCIQQVKRAGHFVNTWICTKYDCNNCAGNFCSYLPLTVSTEGTLPPNLPDHADCRYGDTVKLEMTYSDYGKLTVEELWVIGKQG